MTVKRVSKFGRVALDLGYLNITQLEECLHLQFEFQKSGKEVPRLGSLLLSKGYINPQQLQIILEKQKDAKYNIASESSRNILKFFPAGTYIYHESEKPREKLYLIHEGRVDFYRERKLLESLTGKGRFFGEVAFLTRKNYTETAVTARDSKVFVIPATEVESFFKNRPEMGMRIAKRIAERLNSLILETNPFLTQTAESSTQKPNIQPNPAELPAPPDTTEKATVLSPAEKIKAQAMQKLHAKTRPQQQNISLAADVSTAPAPKKTAADPLAEIKARALKKSLSGAEMNSTSIPVAASVEIPSEQSDIPHAGTEDALTEISRDKPEINREDTTENSLQMPMLELRSLDPEHFANPEIISAEIDPTELITNIAMLKSEPFSRDIVSAVKSIVNLHIKIDKNDRERTEFANTLIDPTEILKAEISKQKKEITRIPHPESLTATLAKLTDMLNPTPGEPAIPPTANTPQNESGHLDAEPRESATDAENSGGKNVRSAIDKSLKRAYEFAITQKKLLLERYTILPDVIRTCAKYSENEPLYKLLLKYDIDSSELFGWGIYQMALEEYAAQQDEKITGNRAEITELESNIRSLTTLLKIGKNADAENEERLKELLAQESTAKLIQTIVRREIKNVTKIMADEFWKYYLQISLLLLTELPEIDRVMLKCFLRYGLLGYSSKWIDIDRCQKILTSCAAALSSPVYSTSASYIYYADEIIELTGKGYLPTSPNEDLELNHRNSPEWRCDKSYKRYIYLKLQYGTLLDVLQIQKEQIETIANKLKEATDRETLLLKTHSRTTQYRAKLSAVKQEMQGYKVRSTRINSLINKINTEMIPKLFEDTDTAITNIKNTGLSLNPVEITKHEVKCIRRSSRLVAKLKEPFLPFTLRDQYKDSSDIINSREYITELCTEAEQKDPLLFQNKLIPSTNRKQRILARKPPIITITPSCGILGFIISPRTGMENGRFTLPGYYEKTMLSKEVFTSVLADFRFDCSKAEAGVDIMTSDTLVAAYSTYRWNMRKKKKEVRKKASVYLEETERNNWRRQYELYMNSALESGKYLFFRCPDLYDIIINKFIDLPEGCEKLKR